MGGRWRGCRVDGRDGTRSPIVVCVRAILGGAGMIEEIEVGASPGVYLGFGVHVFDVMRGVWVRKYVNQVRRKFVEYEGEASRDGRSVDFRRADAMSGDRSWVKHELLADGSWERIMRVSSDGGATWRVLWSDHLMRQ